MLMVNGASNNEARSCLELNAENIGSSDSFGAGLLRPDLALQDWQDGACSGEPVCLSRSTSCSLDSECCSGVCRNSGVCR
jgi:hypothetical protein